MINLKKISHKKLTKLLIESDDIAFIEEMARRINSGLIPLAIIDFSKLSNKKLSGLDNLTFENCNWVYKEIYKRIKDGRIPSRVVTIEEVRDMYRRARQVKA